MAKANTTNLKNHVSMTDFAASLAVSKPTISTLAKKGVLPSDVFVKSGKQLFVNIKGATAALKNAPIADKGQIPAWAIKVGNKAAVAKAKAMAKANAATAKAAA